MEPQSPMSVDGSEHSTPKIVILHPGSHSLKFGLLNDSWPQFMSHVVAFRTSATQQTKSNKSIVLVNKKQTTGVLKITIKSADLQDMDSKRVKSAREEAYKAAEQSVNLILEQISNKKRKYNEEVYDELNSLKMEKEDDTFCWADVSKAPKVVVGEKCIAIPPSEPYELFWPMRYGRLNFTKTPQYLTSALEHIWEFALKDRLNLNLNELKNCKAFLIIPDKFDPLEIKIMVDVLFRKFGFESVAIQQESICATFGVGVATCCVVDIGHQKTNICCIDEGLIIPNTRICFNYGGQNINRALLYCMQQSRRHYFPYTECNPSNLRDEESLTLLKESLSHLRDQVEIENFEFRSRQKGKPTKVFRLNVSDALLLSPLSLFHPGLLEPIDNPKPRPHFYIEDLYDEDFVKEIYGRKPEELEEASPFDSKKLLSIDAAIVQSIRALGDLPETKKKLFSNILLVGGSARFEGLTIVVEDRVFELIGMIHELVDVDKVEVVSQEAARGVDPRFMSWKGATLMCGLDAFDDCWVSKDQWDVYGLRVLRDKATFVWQ